MQLYLVHNAERKKFKCVFCSLVIKNDSLVKSYKGGMKAFMDKHPLFCNENITVCNFMGDDIDVIVDDLIGNGLEIGTDFKYIHADRLAMNIQLGFTPLDLQKDLDFGVNWLKGQYDRGDIFIWFADEPEIHNDRKSKGGQTDAK